MRALAPAVVPVAVRALAPVAVPAVVPVAVQVALRLVHPPAVFVPFLPTSLLPCLFALISNVQSALGQRFETRELELGTIARHSSNGVNSRMSSPVDALRAARVAGNAASPPNRLRLITERQCYCTLWTLPGTVYLTACVGAWYVWYLHCFLREDGTRA